VFSFFFILEIEVRLFFYLAFFSVLLFSAAWPSDFALDIPFLVPLTIFLSLRFTMVFFFIVSAPPTAKAGARSL